MKHLSYFVLCCLIGLAACTTPLSKEEYLSQFERFIERTEENHKKYKQKDWEWADAKFEKYNSEWYLKFRDDFTFEDQIKIKGLILKYHALKNKEGLGDMLRDLFKNDVDEVSDKIEKYMDEDFDDALNSVINGAIEIGDSAVKVIEDAVRLLDE